MIGNTVSKTGYRKLRQWIGYAYCCSYHLFYHEDHLFYQKGLSGNDKSVSWSYALLLSTWLGILQTLWRVQRWWCITQHFTVKKLQWINVLKHQKMIWQIYVLAPLIREGGVFWVAIFFGKWKYCSWGRTWKISKGWLVNYLMVLIKIIAKWRNTFFL